MYGKTCRGEMSVTTRRPQNGGSGTGLSVRDLGSTSAASSALRLHRRLAQPLALRGALALLGRRSPSILPPAIASIMCRPVERVLAVEQRALVERRQVVLGVVARQRRAAEQHRHLHALRVQLLEVLLHHATHFTSRPLMPIASAFFSLARREDVVRSAA